MAKVSDADIAEIQALQATFTELAKHYGELHIQEFLIEEQINKSKEVLRQLNDKQNILLQRLQDLYGIGTVNMQTGEFVPAATPTE